MVELSFLKKLESFEYTSDKPKLKDVLLWFVVSSPFLYWV
jgi:hypothetical protein